MCCETRDVSFLHLVFPRNSFGTLLPATPSLPVPPFLLGLGACASVAVVETLHRLFTALLFDTEVEEW